MTASDRAPSSPPPLQLLFDNTDRLQALANGLPEFALDAGDYHAILFTPPCEWCNFTIGDLGLYLRQRTPDTYVTISAQVFAVNEVNGTCTAISAYAAVSPVRTFTVHLSQKELPYVLPLNFVVDVRSPLVNATAPPGAQYTQLDPIYGSTVYALHVSVSNDVWWVASKPLPAVPVAYQSTPLSYQISNSPHLDWYVDSCNPPTGLDYWPSIYLTGGRPCPTPTRTATATPTPSVTPSVSASASVTSSVSASVSATSSVTPSRTASSSSSASPSPTPSPSIFVPDRRLEETTGNVDGRRLLAAEEEDAADAHPALQGRRLNVNSPSPTQSATPSHTSSVTPTVSPSSSPIPCDNRTQITMFNNIDFLAPLMQEEGTLHLRGGSAAALVFEPPCRGCNFTLTALDMILQAPKPGYFDWSGLYFTVTLCQFNNNNNQLQGCTQSNVTANVTLLDFPTLVGLPVNLTYVVPPNCWGHFKLIITPSKTVDWRLSRPAPALPDTGIVGVYTKQFLMRQPCSHDLQWPQYGPTACWNDQSWQDVGVYPSLRINADIPCYVRTTECAFIEAKEALSNTTADFADINAELFELLCDVNNTFRIVDTTDNLKVVTPAFFQVVPNATIYTLWFDNPCLLNDPYGLSSGCTFNLSRVVLPLSAINDTTVSVEIFYQFGGPGSPIVAEVVRTEVLPVPFDVEFITIDLSNARVNNSQPINGISFRFYSAVRWYYSLPATDPLHQYPSFGAMPFVDFPYDTTRLVYSYILPGIYLGAVFDYNTTCNSSSLYDHWQYYSAADWRKVHNVTCYPLPVVAPPAYEAQPCLGGNNVVVTDNTLSGRYYKETGFVLLRDTTFALTFSLPCTHCNVHLSQLYLPLQRLNSTYTTITVALAILSKTSYDGLQPEEWVWSPHVNSATQSVVHYATFNLAVDHAFYTIPLPQAFDLAYRSEPSLTWALLIRSSQPVIWRDGLEPQYSLLNNPPPMVARVLAYDAADGIYTRAVDAPAVRLTSWTQPWQQCLPTPSPNAQVSRSPQSTAQSSRNPQNSRFPVPWPSGSALPSRIPLPHVSDLPVSIFAYISIEIYIFVATLTPATFLTNLVLFFLFRLSIALFVNLPVDAVRPAGFYMLPSGLTWYNVDPFADGTGIWDRRLGAAEETLAKAQRDIEALDFGRQLQTTDSNTGMGVRFVLITSQSGQQDTTKDIAKLLSGATASDVLQGFLGECGGWVCLPPVFTRPLPHRMRQLLTAAAVAMCAHHHADALQAPPLPTMRASRRPRCPSTPLAWSSRIPTRTPRAALAPAATRHPACLVAPLRASPSAACVRPVSSR